MSRTSKPLTLVRSICLPAANGSRGPVGADADPAALRSSRFRACCDPQAMDIAEFHRCVRQAAQLAVHHRGGDPCGAHRPTSPRSPLVPTIDSLGESACELNLHSSVMVGLRWGRVRRKAGLALREEVACLSGQVVMPVLDSSSKRIWRPTARHRRRGSSGIRLGWPVLPLPVGRRIAVTPVYLVMCARADPVRGPNFVHCAVAGPRYFACLASSR